MIRQLMSMGFQTRLTLLVLLVLLPAFGLVWHGNLQQMRLEHHQLREMMKARARLAAATQRHLIDDARQLLSTLNQFPFLTLAEDRVFAETHLANLKHLHSDFADIGLIESDGSLFCTALKTNSHASLAGDPAYQEALRTRSFSMGPLTDDPVSGEPVIRFGIPVMNDEGTTVRVLYASVGTRLLSKVLEEVPLPSGCVIEVFDSQGRLVAASPFHRSRIGTDHSLDPVFKTATQLREGLFELENESEEETLYGVSFASDDHRNDLTVLVQAPGELSHTLAFQNLIWNTMVMLLVAALVIAGVWIYARHGILQPITALVSAAGRLSHGDLAARTGVKSGNDEIKQLEAAFDTMADAFTRREEELRAANEEMRRANETLEKRVKDRTALLEEANKELEAFAYSVSHDLRAPLRHIQGYADLLSQHASGKLSDKSERFLHTITDAAGQMGWLIDDLLAFSRIGRAELHERPVALDHLVQESIQRLELSTQDRAIDWRIGPMPNVVGDFTTLLQVMMNLIGNAVKFTRHRNPAVIEVGTKNGENGEVVLFVRDNGAGFNMQYAHKLFGVFQRLHHADDFEGTGIGLATVRRIIARHGGRVWAEGEVDRGATFFFTLKPANPEPGG